VRFGFRQGRILIKPAFQKIVMPAPRTGQEQDSPSEENSLIQMWNQHNTVINWHGKDG
jgi:hypothetical protein